MRTSFQILMRYDDLLGLVEPLASADGTYRRTITGRCGENLSGKSQGGSKMKFTAAGTQILFECISQSQVDGG